MLTSRADLFLITLIICGMKDNIVKVEAAIPTIIHMAIL
jgi:hypothetical protein